MSEIISCVSPTTTTVEIITEADAHDVFLLSVDVESTGAYQPQALLPAAVQVMTRKIQTLLEGLDTLEADLGVASSRQAG